jgi:integrase
MSLTDAACRTARSAGRLHKLSDGGGLQLWVFPHGSKLWRVAYRYGGKQKLLAVGPYPLVSLADAREARNDLKKQLRSGVDPSDARRAAHTSAKQASNTFATFADQLLELKRKGGKAEATLTKLTWLIGLALPKLGSRHPSKISAAEVLGVLRAVEQRERYETAKRLRAVIGAVFRLAVASGEAETDPTFALRDALASPPRKSRAAVTTPKEFGALLRVIDGFDGQPTTKAALQLLALLFPRPGELRAARWAEINWSDGVWTIPADRTKMRRPHHVPLSKQALAVLAKLQQITGQGPFLFPSIRTVKKTLSENTFNAALRRLGYTQEEATAHGFRASASTLLNEAGLWNRDAIERQLAHVDEDEVRRAYARGFFWEERIKMMQWWADYLDELKSSQNIVPLQRLAS